MMKYGRWLILSILCLVVFVGGAAFTATAEELIIVGTGSGTTILEAIGQAFTTENPGITVSVPPSIGSGGGIKAVGRDEYLIGRVARGIKEKEKPYGLTYVPYADMPIVFYVNKSVSVTELSVQQILDIYSGKITNWSEVGGDDARIRVVTREEGDSSLGVLLKLFPGFKDITITSKSKTTFSDPETEETVISVADTIAYGSYPNVKALEVNILTIEEKNAANADYPYVGALGLIYKEANYDGAIKAFVEFLKTEAAHGAILEVGGIPK